VESLCLTVPLDISDYCRQIEAYLCQKNDGHLIRVVGPSFEMVSRWASDGVPLKVAFGGIDRYVERYYRKGPRRRPVRIDFCEADVLEVFDEWRRATGLTAVSASEAEARTTRRGVSLPEHLERVLRRLTNARAMGAIGPAADALIDQISEELDRARASAGGLRGEARTALLERLVAADAALLAMARLAVDRAALDQIRLDAHAELTRIGEHMPADVLARALERSIDQLLRERLGLPTIIFS
jgi:hypothetical protein